MTQSLQSQYSLPAVGRPPRFFGHSSAPDNAGGDCAVPYRYSMHGGYSSNDARMEQRSARHSDSSSDRYGPYSSTSNSNGDVIIIIDDASTYGSSGSGTPQLGSPTGHAAVEEPHSGYAISMSDNNNLSGEYAGATNRSRYLGGYWEGRAASQHDGYGPVVVEDNRGTVGLGRGNTGGVSY